MGVQFLRNVMISSLFMIAPALADTITAAEIATNIGKNKTELEQESWWEENMAGKYHEFSGTVSDVEKGAFSGYWIILKIGRNIEVRCGLGDEHEDVAKALKKGSKFTCKGDVGSTWTAIFGTSFDVDYRPQ